MAKTKTTTNYKETKTQYREKKLGLIDRLSIALLRKQEQIVKDTEHPPVSNIRRFFGYLIDFALSNIFCVIPLVIIQACLTGSTNTTQILAGIPLYWAYIITFFVFLFYIFYYVYIPWKVWPGQTPAKRLLKYKIVMMDNSEVSAKALFLRNVIAMTFIELAVFTTTYIVQLVVLTAHIDYPSFFGYVTYFMTFLSFLLTLTNYNRRMIHDYLGGTKVYMLPAEEGSKYHAL
ncbi:RDD family protein [Amedibacillus sp. YH-ame6]